MKLFSKLQLSYKAKEKKTMKIFLLYLHKLIQQYEKHR